MFAATHTARGNCPETGRTPRTRTAMEHIQQLLDGSQIPAVTAFLLGLLTAISPCPMATNVTAVGFISRNGQGGQGSRRTVLRNGIMYGIGRCLAYTLLGTALIYIIRTGADTFELQDTVVILGEYALGPALIAIGTLMLATEFVSLGGKFGFSPGAWAERLGGPAGAFALGVLFAMAFCPTSGLFFFGMLVPLSASTAGGYLLPLVYGMATALPVLTVAWALAFSIQSLGRLVGGIHIFQRWLNRAVALLFIAVGIYYCRMMFA